MSEAQFYSEQDLAKLNKGCRGVMPSWAVVADYLVVKLKAEETGSVNILLMVFFEG